MTEIAPVLQPEVLPEYIASTVLDGEAREEAMRMMARLAEHVRNKTTDQAEGNWQEPVENYSDEELFQAELDLIFKRIPLPLALSVELPGKNTYKAMEAAGVVTAMNSNGGSAGGGGSQPASRAMSRIPTSS